MESNRIAAGITVLVHNQDEPPQLMKSAGIAVSPGTETTLALTTNQVTFYLVTWNIQLNNPGVNNPAICHTTV